MAWVAGYHNSDRRTSRRKTEPTWAEARAVMVDELDQRVMALEAEPVRRRQRGGARRPPSRPGALRLP